MNRIELAFRRRPVAQSELDRNIIKPARREAAIEMPHPRNDHARDRNTDVGTRLIENEEVEACAPDRLHAGRHLLARVEPAERRVGAGLDRRIAAWRQIGMVLQAEWRGAVKARFVSVAVAHEADGQELVQLGERAQQRQFAHRNARRTRTRHFPARCPSSAPAPRSSEFPDRW